MTKTTRGYTLRKTLREIVDEGGLPEKISTEAQLWDEIFIIYHHVFGFYL